MTEDRSVDTGGREWIEERGRLLARIAELEDTLRLCLNRTRT